MDKLFGTTVDVSLVFLQDLTVRLWKHWKLIEGSLFTPSNQRTDSPLWRGCRRTAGSCLHTWRAGDSRRRWAACLLPGPRCCADTRRSIRTLIIKKIMVHSNKHDPLLLLTLSLLCWWTSAPLLLLGGCSSLWQLKGQDKSVRTQYVHTTNLGNKTAKINQTWHLPVPN